MVISPTAQEQQISPGEPKKRRVWPIHKVGPQSGNQEYISTSQWQWALTHSLQLQKEETICLCPEEVQSPMEREGQRVWGTCQDKEEMLGEHPWPSSHQPRQSPALSSNFSIRAAKVTTSTEFQRRLGVSPKTGREGAPVRRNSLHNDRWPDRPWGNGREASHEASNTDRALRSQICWILSWGHWNISL